METKKLITIERAVVEQARDMLVAEEAITTKPNVYQPVITAINAALESAENDASIAWYKSAMDAVAESVEPFCYAAVYNADDPRETYTTTMKLKDSFGGTPDRVFPLYTHPAPAAPEVLEGYQLVPKEPTEEMWLEGADIYRKTGNTVKAYKAMLQAAPEPKK